MARESRPKIPADVARQLRREGGFGCCVCGHPIIQYHHIVPWSEDKHYRPEDMMVLCPNHHDEASVMPVGEQRKYKTLPHNVANGCVSGALKMHELAPVVWVGSCFLVGDGTEFGVEGTTLLELSSNELGGLEVTVQLENEKGELLALIVRNEWVVGNAAVWDIEAKYQRLLLRNAERAVCLDLDVSRTPLGLTVSLWCRQRLFRLDKGGIHFGGMGIGGGATDVISFKNLCFVSSRFRIDEWRPQADGSNRIGFAVGPNEMFKRMGLEWAYMRPIRDGGTLSQAVRDAVQLRQEARSRTADGLP